MSTDYSLAFAFNSAYGPNSGSGSPGIFGPDINYPLAENGNNGSAQVSDPQQINRNPDALASLASCSASALASVSSALMDQYSTLGPAAAASACVAEPASSTFFYTSGYFPAPLATIASSNSNKQVVINSFIVTFVISLVILIV